MKTPAISFSTIFVWAALTCDSWAATPRVSQVQELSHQLESPDPAVAIKAAEQIKQLGPEARDAVPALLKRLSGKGTPVMVATADALFHVDKATFTKRLKLAEPGSSERHALVLAVSHARTKARDLSSILLNIAKNSLDPDYEHAIVSLGYIDAPLDEALPILTTALRKGGQYARMLAASSLQEYGKKAVDALPALYDALEDEDGMVRVRAAHAVWAIEKEHSKILPVLLAEFGKRRPGRMTAIKQVAVRCLGDIGPAAKQAVPFLVELWKGAAQEERDHNRNLIRKAIQAIDAEAAKAAGII